MFLLVDILELYVNIFFVVAKDFVCSDRPHGKGICFLESTIMDVYSVFATVIEILVFEAFDLDLDMITFIRLRVNTLVLSQKFGGWI